MRVVFLFLQFARKWSNIFEMVWLSHRFFFHSLRFYVWTSNYPQTRRLCSAYLSQRSAPSAEEVTHYFSRFFIVINESIFFIADNEVFQFRVRARFRVMIASASLHDSWFLRSLCRLLQSFQSVDWHSFLFLSSTWVRISLVSKLLWLLLLLLLQKRHVLISLSQRLSIVTSLFVKTHTPILRTRRACRRRVCVWRNELWLWWNGLR